MTVYPSNLKAYKPSVRRDFLKSLPVKRRKEVTIKSLKKPYVSDKTRQANRHKVNLAHVIEHLKAHPCVECAETDVVVLEFDHREPSGKRLNIGSSLWNVSLETLKAEIDKCDVRCCNCHRRRHSNRAESAKRYGILLI